MLSHPNPEVQAVYRALEAQRDQALSNHAITAGQMATLEAQVLNITQANEALSQATVRLQAELDALKAPPCLPPP